MSFLRLPVRGGGGMNVPSLNFKPCHVAFQKVFMSLL